MGLLYVLFPTKNSLRKSFLKYFHHSIVCVVFLDKSTAVNVIGYICLTSQTV